MHDVPQPPQRAEAKTSDEPIRAIDSEEVRQLLSLATEEARQLKHSFVGTEQLLLALMQGSNEQVHDVFANSGLTLETVRTEIIRVIGGGYREPDGREIPLTPRAKRALELAEQEAMRAEATVVSTSHLALALLSENDGVAIRVLENLGKEPKAICSALVKQLAAKQNPGLNV